jgi:hypothetical protein
VGRAFEIYRNIQDVDHSNLDRYKMSIIGELSGHLLKDTITELTNLKDKGVEFPTNPDDYIDGVQTMFIYNTLFALPSENKIQSNCQLQLIDQAINPYQAQLANCIAKIHAVLYPIEILVKSSTQNQTYLKGKYFEIISKLLFS